MTLKRLSPIVAAARSSVGLIRLAPATVLTTIGKNAAYATIRTAAGVPVPSQRIASGRIAIAAIGRKLSTSGSTLRSTRRNEPIASPSGIASSAAIAKPANTRPRLCTIASGNSPDSINCKAAATTRVGTGVRGFPVMTPHVCQTNTSASGNIKLRHNRLGHALVTCASHRLPMA